MNEEETIMARLSWSISYPGACQAPLRPEHVADWPLTAIQKIEYDGQFAVNPSQPRVTVCSSL